MALKKIQNQTNSTSFKQIEKSCILYKNNLLGLSLENAQTFSCISSNLIDLEHCSKDLNNGKNYLPSLLVYNFLSQDYNHCEFNETVASNSGFKEFSNTLIIKNLLKYHYNYTTILRTNFLFYNLKKKTLIVYIFELQDIYTILPFLFLKTVFIEVKHWPRKGLKKNRKNSNKKSKSLYTRPKGWSQKELEQNQRDKIRKSKSFFILPSRRITKKFRFTKAELIQLLHSIKKRFNLEFYINSLKSESEFFEILEAEQPIFMLLYNIQEKKIGKFYKFTLLDSITFLNSHYFSLVLLDNSVEKNSNHITDSDSDEDFNWEYDSDEDSECDSDFTGDYFIKFSMYSSKCPECSDYDSECYKSIEEAEFACTCPCHTKYVKIKEK